MDGSWTRRNRQAVVAVLSVFSIAMISDRVFAQGGPRHSATAAPRAQQNKSIPSDRPSSVYSMNTTALFQSPTSPGESQWSGKRILQTSGQQITARAVTKNTAVESAETSARKHGTLAGDPNKTVNLGSGPDFASQLPDDQSNLVQFIEILQWTIVVLLIAVVAALTLRKYQRAGQPAARNSVITHLATLPVRNHFQAHLLEIGTQKFLVTTDRSGVKTVNPITRWEDFEVPVEDSQEPSTA